MSGKDPAELYREEKERRLGSGRDAEYKRLMAEAQAKYDADQASITNSKQSLHAMRGQARMNRNQKKK